MLWVFLATIVTVAAQHQAPNINCSLNDDVSKSKILCKLDNTTVISEEEVTFAGLEDSDVNEIEFVQNTKIEFLPVKVYKKFPNLKTYLAEWLGIKKISALNFERLSGLRTVDLGFNQIETIPDDCFKDLNLFIIILRSNRIKTVNGIAFANMVLREINLYGNICIDSRFLLKRGSNQALRRISRNCGSTDIARKQLSCITSPFCAEQESRDPETSCCELENETYIDAPDFAFKADQSRTNTTYLHIMDQQDVQFLPVSLHERFTNLRTYDAVRTAISKISKRNFEKLFKLERLILLYGEIEVIRSDTFEDLVSLKRIYIENQRLIALNGKAFEGLINLEKIALYNEGYCIDSVFESDHYDDHKNFRSRTLEKITSNCGFEEVDTVEVLCEKFGQFSETEFCRMDETTAINAANFIIGDVKDDEITGIDFSSNKKIEYLPYKIYIQLPNLREYWAGNCSIKEISKENFEKLNRLKTINLDMNQIKKISANTFKGLEQLRQVFLGDNQIKSINGRTFDQLPRLEFVDLTKNECIDTLVEESSQIKNLTRKIIQQCAFTETGEREFEKVFDIECGVGLSGTGFIVGGNETKRGQWPFMVSLIFEPKNQFFCGGNVITESHVLTAAHCIQSKHQTKPLESSQIVVLYGRHDISLRAEVGSEIRGLEEIKVHPRWNPRDQKFEGDIAVLVVDRLVQFSELIKPVCLTVEPEILQLEAGYVVGWGKSESAALHEVIPRQVLISAVTSDVCFAKDFELGSLFAEGMFCAGGDGFGPCHGDSGGGFFVRYHGLWTLRGVVSSGKEKENGGCDVDRFTLFTNALDCSAWISEVTTKNATLMAA